MTRFRAGTIPALLAALMVLASTPPRSLAQTPPDPAPSDGGYIALVIGGGAEGGPAGEASGRRDALAVADRLRARGFRLVGSAADGTCTSEAAQHERGLKALAAALDCLEKAGNGALQVVVYHSGPMLAIDSRLYLVPSDASPSDKPDPATLISLEGFQKGISRSNPKMALVLLDGGKTTAPEPPLDKQIDVATLRGAVLAAFAPGTGTAGGTELSAAPGPAEQGAAQPGSAVNGPPDATSPLGPLARNITKQLDTDLSERSMGDAGKELRTLVRSLSTWEGAAQGAPVIMAAVSSMPPLGMLGRMPEIGRETCDLLTWRATTLKLCVEIAAAYKQCGERDAFKDLLKSQCSSDWDLLMRQELRSALPRTIRTNTCEAIKGLVARFANESSVQSLSEYKELSSLAQYTCALEAKAAAKKELDEIKSSRDCTRVQKFLASSEAADSNMRKSAEELESEVCCPNVSLKGACIPVDDAQDKILSMLAKKGCDLGRKQKDRLRRAEVLIAQALSGTASPVKLDERPAKLDDAWAALEKMPDKDCKCKNQAVVASTGACKSGNAR